MFINSGVQAIERARSSHTEGAIQLGSCDSRRDVTESAHMGEARFGKERVVPAQPRLVSPWRAGVSPASFCALQSTDPKEQIPIAVPAIIESDLFATVQECLAEHKRHPGQTAPRPAHLLSGLVVCKKCGYAYVAHRSGPKGAGKLYYCCLGVDAGRFHGQKVCSNPSLQAPLLEEAVWNDVRALLLEPERLAQEFERRFHGDAKTTTVARTVQALDRQISQLKRRVARLVEMYADGHIDKDKFQKDVHFSKRRLSEFEQARQIEMEKDGEQRELRLLIGEIEEFAKSAGRGSMPVTWRPEGESLVHSSNRSRLVLTRST